MLTTALISNCGTSERPRSSAPASSTSANAPDAAPLRIFSSDTTRGRLLLRADSTFVLELPSANLDSSPTISGKLAITDDHYHLFFSDTIAHFNELLTAVHPDASLVAYPDYSVVLDKKLRQLYVRGTLVRADTIEQP